MKKRYNKPAFSIVEAFITLLIVSIALASAAPLISRQVKHSQFSSLQVLELVKKIEELESGSSMQGAVVPFYGLTTCPTGWKALTEKNLNYEGVFIRNIGGNASDRELVQDDAAPNFSIQIPINEDLQAGLGGSAYSGIINGEVSSLIADNTSTSKYAVFNASKANDSYQDVDEIRPKNIALLYCVKD